MKNLKLLSALLIMISFKLRAQDLAQNTAPAGSPATNSMGTAAQGLAPTKPAPPARAKLRENILDFEAEVIEGEKKRPELFLDIKAGDGNVGSGLYLRSHFDDFFAVDKKRRPRFVKSK